MENPTKDLFDKIAKVIPIVYLYNPAVGIVPPPVNADTAKMKFINSGKYVIGYLGDVTQKQIDDAIAVLPVDEIEKLKKDVEDLKKK